MGVAKKEPIIEIFASEAGDSIKAFDKYMLEGENAGKFERELIVELAKLVRIIRMAVFQSISNVRMAKSSPLMRMELMIKNGIVLHYQEISLFF